MIRNYEKVMNVEVADIRDNFIDATSYKCLHPHLDQKHFPSCSFSKVRTIWPRLGLSRPTLSSIQVFWIQRKNHLGTLHQQRFCKDLTCLASVKDVNKLTILVYIQTVSASIHLVHTLGHFVAQNRMLVFIHKLNAFPTLSGRHTLVWNDAFLGSVDVVVKWANQMIETYLKLLSFVRKYY